MYGDIEAMLTRELRQVADHVEVPALPTLPTGPPPRATAWPPLLVAAALVVVALATVATLLRTDDGQTIQPAPRPSQVATDAATDTVPDAVPTGPPTVPWALDGVLHVDDRTYPGYDEVEGTTSGWMAKMTGVFAYAWGNTGRPKSVPVATEQPPALSPDGSLLAWLSVDGQLNGFQTDPAGEGFGLGVEVPVRGEDGVSNRVLVTDDGLVVASGSTTGVLWRPFLDGETVDLTETAPDQQLLEATPAGVVVQDGTVGPEVPPYLAELSPEGTLTRLADLPVADEHVVGERWVAWIPPGTIGGEASTSDTLGFRLLDGSRSGSWAAPDGFAFRSFSARWESGDTLVAVVAGPRGAERMVRCSPELGECVLLDVR